MAPKSRRGSCPINRKNVSILTALYHLNNEQRRALIRTADASLVRQICECALNILHGNIPLTKTHKSRLRKHANTLRKLASHSQKSKDSRARQYSFNSKKKLLLQRGGGAFLPALLAPLITSLFTKLLA